MPPPNDPQLSRDLESWIREAVLLRNDREAPARLSAILNNWLEGEAQAEVQYVWAGPSLTLGISIVRGDVSRSFGLAWFRTQTAEEFVSRFLHSFEPVYRELNLFSGELEDTFVTNGVDDRDALWTGWDDGEGEPGPEMNVPDDVVRVTLNYFEQQLEAHNSEAFRTALDFGRGVLKQAILEPTLRLRIAHWLRQQDRPHLEGEMLLRGALLQVLLREGAHEVRTNLNIHEVEDRIELLYSALANNMERLKHALEGVEDLWSALQSD